MDSPVCPVGGRLAAGRRARQVSGGRPPGGLPVLCRSVSGHPGVDGRSAGRGSGTGGCLVCLFTKRLELQLTLVAWLAVNFFAYGICLVLTHYSPQTSGIGRLTDPLGLSRGVTGMMLQWIPYYLLGSLAGLVWCWLEPRRARVAARQKMFCPLCGIHIEFAVKDLGRKISCPGCKTTTILRREEYLKMSCSFCHEHVEFPSYALGQHIQCPHCGIGITLKEPA